MIASECTQNWRWSSLWVRRYAMLDNGQNPPVPVGDVRRTAQVNIRIATQEKSLLEQPARAHGYHGVSDYLRDRALSAGRSPARAIAFDEDGLATNQ